MNIYNMCLGEVIKENDYRILRVAGGWIYTFDVGSVISSVFVPFNNEFMDPSVEMLKVKKIPIGEDYGNEH